jgi:hypothetical protein
VANGGKLVMGRIVSLEGGRPIVQVPVGPGTTDQTSVHAQQMGALIKAAREYKARQNSESIKALCVAALALD